MNIELKPLLEKLNTQSFKAVEGAVGLCMVRGHYEISIKHVLLKLLEEPAGDIPLIFGHYGIKKSKIEKCLLDALEEIKTGNPDRPTFSLTTVEWFQEGWLIASIDLGESNIRTGSLLLALMSNSRYEFETWFDELRAIPADDLRRHFNDITDGSPEQVRLKVTTEGLETRKEGGALERFTIDFTGRARAGEIDPVFGRGREIDQIIDILGRRRKNNPIVVGEAGVGKTAIVEGLALQIVQKEVPRSLQDVEVYGLDLGLLQAGAGVKGEFENRLKSVLDEVKRAKAPIILFIDEAHTLIGAGGTAGGSDAANLLKPALARGELRSIAATTWSEYKRYFEQDAALARRFQLVKLDEPLPEHAIEMLRGLRGAYETSHDVYVRDDALEAAVKLSTRYITGRQLPDKAFDLLDTACSRVHLSLTAKPDRVKDIERRIDAVERELSAIERDIGTGVAPAPQRKHSLESTDTSLKTELAELQSRWQKELAVVSRILELRRQTSEHSQQKSSQTDGGESLAQPLVQERVELEAAASELLAIQGNDALVHYEVTPKLIAKVVSDWTGVPLGSLVQEEAKALLDLESLLKARIKGQDHVAAAVADRIRVGKVGLRDEKKTNGVFLFVGPSGVGKTECALAVADLVFGGERFLTTINMSEFQEKHMVSRLIGSPPGYVGFREGGRLTEAVRQRPYSVVLLDEAEKADPQVMNLFYQVFDKGVLADGEGREIDFKNTVFFLTSNLASETIIDLSSGSQRPDPESIVETIRPALNRHFGDALLNRIEIIPFYALDVETLKEIVKIKLSQLKSRLEQNQGIPLHYGKGVVEELAKRSAIIRMGARNIEFILQKHVIPRIGTLILENMGTDNKLVAVELSVNDNGDFIVDARV
jgi:type VI secretion system protein VasG